MGGKSSKLKNRRNERLSWSTRFQSKTLKERKLPPTPVVEVLEKTEVVPAPTLHNEPVVLVVRERILHKDVHYWLDALNLTQYESLFIGVNGVEDLLENSEEDLFKLGVKNAAHRAAMITSLVILKNKLERGNNSYKKQLHIRHSLAVDGGNTKRDGGIAISVESDTKQSKSLCSLNMDSSGESNGASARELRRALEQELALDARDLRSHGWYHGPIPRARAERLLTADGDFLVRDCSSQPGDYVLSCKSKGVPLHFVINKVIIQPDTVYERLQYRFEDDAYDTVADLITYYVGSGTYVTSASAARIQYPRNRTQPLSHYSSQYERAIPTLPIANPYHNKHVGNQPPTLPLKKQEKCNSADGVIRGNGNETFNTHSLPRLSASRSPRTDRRRFDAPDETEEMASEAPPKPCRIPTSLVFRASTYQASGSDSGNGSGDSAQSSAAGDGISDANQRHNGVIIKNPRFLTNSASSTTLKNFVEFDAEAAAERLENTRILDLHYDSRFDTENFQTLLLPAIENKPLDVNALRSILDMLSETGSRMLANYLTKVDAEFILGIREDNKENVIRNDSFCLTNGLGLICLPHGHQFRLDLIERTLCMKLMVAMTILTCPTDKERAGILHKWIQVAIDTKTALGNLYGFCGIMFGLCLPQVQKLERTWHILRQHYTDSAFQFDAKLRPTLKAMNEGNDPQAPNTTIPHILPAALLMERKLEDFRVGEVSNVGLESFCLSAWEKNSADFGLCTLYQHMQASREFPTAIKTFRRTANNALQDVREDDVSCDAFRTEFQLKFLWGSKGATLKAEERHSKFEQVLTMMADKLNRDTPLSPNQ